MSEKKLGKWANWSNPEVEEENVREADYQKDYPKGTEEEKNVVEEPEKVIEEKEIKNPEKPVKEHEKKSKYIGVEDAKAETKRIKLFLGLVFIFTWVVEIGAMIPMFHSGDAQTIQEAVKIRNEMLFAPAFAAVFARAATREGFGHSGFQFNFGKHKFCFLFGWFGMTVICFLGAILYFVIFRKNYDPEMTAFVDAQVASGFTEEPVRIIATFKTNLLIQCMTAPVLDLINSASEEWGWRAYLLPKLYRKVGTIPAILLTGVLSGIWYAPMVYTGYIYGTGYPGEPVSGIIGMCLFGTVTGIIYASLSLLTGSIFPAVFAHSAMNVMMVQGVFFTGDGGNVFVGPAPTGIIGGLPLILVAAGFLYYIAKHPVKPSNEKAGN